MSNKDNEELASHDDIAKFVKNVTQFNRAKWDTDYLESGHCFYNGKDPVNDRIVLAHAAWRPKSDTQWIWIKPNKSAECYSTHLDNCEFIL